MTNSHKMTRREWFRLSKPHSPTNTQTRPQSTDKPERSMGQSTAELTPVEHPVNHDGMDLSQLPPMREALLSAEQIELLFADIEQFATDILLMQRSSRTAQATVSKASTSEQLSTAKNGLLSAKLKRLQIRYRWQNAAWIDTLESRPDGFRLIRIVHTT